MKLIKSIVPRFRELAGEMDLREQFYRPVRIGCVPLIHRTSAGKHKWITLEVKA